MSGKSGTQKRVDEARRKIQVVKDFMKAIESAGGKVPDGLTRAVNRYLLAVKIGTDVAEAADEVSIWLKKIYEDLYMVCREEAQGDDDAYWICRAGIDRKWQARNVDAVLNWNNDKSMARRLWDKWKKELADWLFDEAKGKVKERAPELILKK